jgi:hypothetical protein
MRRVMNVKRQATLGTQYLLSRHIGDTIYHLGLCFSPLDMAKCRKAVAQRLREGRQQLASYIKAHP